MSRNWVKLLILVMCAIFLLVGCSDVEESVDESVKEKIEEIQEVDNEKEEERDEEKVKEEDVEEKEETNFKEGDDKEKELVGYWDDDVYVNEFFDFKVELPKDWEKMSEKELKSKSESENLNYLLSINSDTGENINIAYQDLRDYGATEEIINTTDIDDYLQMYYSEFKNLTIYDEVEMLAKEKIGKNEFGAIKMSMGFTENITIHQKMYCLKKDNCILLIYFTGISEASVEDLCEKLS